MKWIFLAFIALLAVAGNVAIFDGISWVRVVGGVAFNLFIFALGAIWWAAYCSSAHAKAKLFVLGHASFMLAAGISMALIGAQAALSNSCESLIFGHRRPGLLSQLLSHVQAYGYCRELGLGIVLFGLFMAYPSIRLFVGLSRRSSGPPSATAER